MNPTAKKTNPQDNERRTPKEVIERAWRVLEDIDLDPASDEDANKRVLANNYFDVEDNGLNHAWEGKVFLNPPGGITPLMIGNELVKASTAGLWWAKLLHEIRQKHTTEALFVCFNLEAMLNTQKHCELPIQAFPFCVPAHRLRYESKNGGKTKNPPGASAIVYLGDRYAAFREHFQDLGFIAPGLSITNFRNNW